MSTDKAPATHDQFLNLLVDAFPGTTIGPATAAIYLKMLQPIAPVDLPATFAAVLARCERFPTMAVVLGIADEVKRARRDAEARTREQHAALTAAPLDPETIAARRAAIAARTRALLERYTNPDAPRDPATTPAPAPAAPARAPDRTRCPNCGGHGGTCRLCRGTGRVCPRCRGARALRAERPDDVRPVYIGCPACTDWDDQPQHTWEKGGWPSAAYDPGREQRAIAAYASQHDSHRGPAPWEEEHR